MNFFSRSKLVILIFIIFYFPYIVQAETCSSVGYSIFTINGINTDLIGAQNNKKALGKVLPSEFNNQPLVIDFLYNPTHLAGFGDLVDAVKQGLFDQKSDYDLVEMLNDASQKVKTQKLLLVAHSQGNFYANNFYDKVASLPGGVPSESIGVYGVASPADRVAGGGKYLTSDTDSVIAAIVGRFLKILPPNIHIPLQNSDGNGHSFSDVYLKYQDQRIVSDIRSSLDKLRTNDVQDSQKPCIDPPRLSLFHKAESVMLFVADPVASFSRTVAVGTAVGTYQVAQFISNSVLTGVTVVASVVVDTAMGAYYVAQAVGNGVSSGVSAVVSGVSSFTQSLFNKNESLAMSNVASVISAVSQPTNELQDSAQKILKEEPKLAEESQTANTEEAFLYTPQYLAPSPVQVVSNSVSTGAIYHGGGGVSILKEIPQDNVAPVISINGDNPAEVIENTAYFDAGATALDDVNGELSVVTTGSVDVAVAGVYTITYTAIDSANNVATNIRTVNVVSPPLPPDTTAPVITILGSNLENINVGFVYNDAGATALDDVDGAVSVSSSGSVNNWVVGVYTIIYTATDRANNTTTVTRTINVRDAVSEISLSASDLNKNGIEDSAEDSVVMDSNMSLSVGEYRFNNLSITNNAILTLAGNPLSENSFKGVKITAVNLNIDSGSSISANKTGYKAGTGPGASSLNYVGASYGGFSYNGAASSVTYGSATRPIDLGSGGANANTGTGGGAMRIVVSDTFINNGIVSANGGEASSGGSIFVTANNLAGNGKFSANGGNLFYTGYFKSPGGGGRVAVYYQSSLFNGVFEVKGGCGSYDGFSPSCGENGTVGIFNNSTNDFYVNSSWKFLKNDAPFSFNNIFISDNVKVTSEDGVSITANNIFIKNYSSFILSDNQILNIPIINIDKNSTLTLSGSETITANTLVLTGSSTVTVIPEKILTLNIPNINIGEGSYISANAKGYGAASGPGNPGPYDSENPTFHRRGASHGGLGYLNTESSIYGLETAPIDFGSGGNGRFPRGGGAVRLITDVLKNNGIISANGNNTSSGGSIFVTTKTLDGNGSFQANGGESYCPNICFGPGGGGRIAIFYDTSSFLGQIIANGWNGWGGTSKAGTVYTSTTLGAGEVL